MNIITVVIEKLIGFISKKWWKKIFFLNMGNFFMVKKINRFFFEKSKTTNTRVLNGKFVICYYLLIL